MSRDKCDNDVGAQVLNLLRVEQLAVEKVRVQREVFKVEKLTAQFLDKLTFAMCIPQLIGHNFKHIAPFLTPPELAFIKNTVRVTNFKMCSKFFGTDENYGGTGRKSNFVTASSASSIERFYAEYPAHKENVTSKQIEDIWNSTYILYNKPEIKKLCTEQMISQIPDNVKEFLDTLESVMEIIILMMFKSPKEENDRSEMLARKYVSAGRIGSEIYQLIATNRPKLYNNANEIQSGWRSIDVLDWEKSSLEVFCHEAMDKIRDDANAKMEWDWKVTERKQEKANVIKEDIENQYMTARIEHIKIEKELREKEQKIYRQLSGIVSNYEREMKKREAIYDQLMIDFEGIMSNTEKLKDIFYKQQKRYFKLMKEKARYEEKIKQAKLQQLKEIISARKIQRFYRAYRHYMNTHGHKKKRKGRKNKKN